MRRIGGLALCSALAVVVNHWPITLFFHTELLLGSSFAVLALLIWGWPGLLVGLAAGLSGMTHAGDGVALVNGLLALAWLQLFLEYGNGGRRQRDNGRIVLAALAYWLLVGGVIKLLWYRQVLGFSDHLAAAYATRLVLAGVLSAVIGNGLYLAWLAWRARRRRGVVSLRGVVFAVLTVLLSVPAVLMAKLRAAEVHQQALTLQQQQMEQQGRLAAALDPGSRRQLLAQHPSLLLELRQPDGSLWRSDPALFARLARTHEPSAKYLIRNHGDGSQPDPALQLLVPREQPIELLRHQAGYWQIVLPQGDGGQLRLLEQAQPLLELLDGRMQLVSFGRLVLLVLLGSLISDRLALALVRQIERLSRGGPAHVLQPSGLRELDALVRHVDEREQQLEAAREQLLQVLENLPIPVACQRQLPSGTSNLAAELVMLNRQFLRTFGYSAEQLPTIRAWAELAYPDPDYRQTVFARFDAALETSRTARSATGDAAVDCFEVCIRCADGSEREVQVYAVACSDLLIISLIDLSARLQAEQALAAALQRQSLQEQQQRQLLERKLRSSLSAAAVVHEIKQPLSTMLLQCRLGLSLLQQKGLGDSFEVEQALQNLNNQADQVVQIMERMRMLLRNVETDHQPLDLSLITESALLFLQRQLQEAQIDLRSDGLEHSCPVLGDAVQLQIAITNVLRNGIEALAERQAPRHLAVTVLRDADEAMVRVEDSGPGFAAEASALMLSSSKPQGSGIGLFVVRTTLEHHQGRLVIDRSSDLGGAEVELRLPALPAESAAPSDDIDG